MKIVNTDGETVTCDNIKILDLTNSTLLRTGLVKLFLYLHITFSPNQIFTVM